MSPLDRPLYTAINWLAAQPIALAIVVLAATVCVGLLDNPVM